MQKTALSVSPYVIEELLGKLPNTVHWAARRAKVEPWVQEIIFQAQAFVARFSRVPHYLPSEKWHEFVGLLFYHPQTKQITDRMSFGLWPHPPDFAIVSRREIKLDELYPVRQVIAEAQLPEYSDERIPPFFFNR